MSASRIGRPNLMAAVARAQAAARPYLGVGVPQPEALPPRPLGPKYRAAALALAARELAAELAPLPRVLQEIAYRVRERIQVTPQPGDDVLLEDLQRLREPAVALSLNVARLEKAGEGRQQLERQRRKERVMARRGDGIYQRSKTWWLDFLHDGRRHYVRLGKGISRTVAGELASVKRAAIPKGEAGIGRKRKDIAFDEAAKEFLAWAKAEKRPKTARTYGECITQLKRSFSGKRLGEFHPFVIEKHKRMRLEAGAKVMPNRELSVLRALFNRALALGTYEGDNPVRVVKRVKKSEGRVRFLEPHEEAALLAALDEPHRTLVLVGLHAGLRVKAEALSLTWSNVDLQRGLLTVQGAFAKTGKTRTVPLNRTLREALGALKKTATSGHVVTRRDGQPLRSLRTVFMNACARAKLADVTPHALRHTFASRLAMAGVDLRTIQELGGWRSLKMVERYAHLSPSHKAEAVGAPCREFPDAFHDTDRRAVGDCRASALEC